MTDEEGIDPFLVVRRSIQATQWTDRGRLVAMRRLSWEGESVDSLIQGGVVSKREPQSGSPR